ncbi:MAG TPA: FAD-dependent oxidoreductase [Pseudomonadales bacterium]|nr:FAD-dependent oxidoreductase [Pseudomonadales bacterium]
MHVVIIGNGIIALTAAFRIAKRANSLDKITIIGKKERPGSATLAAAAMFNSFGEIEAGSLDTDLDLYRFELSHLAAHMWKKFEDEVIDAAMQRLPSACSECSGFNGGGCIDTGTYIINNTAADDLDDENFDAIVSALENFNEPFQHINPKDIPNYHPHQRLRATRAIYIHGEGWINPRIFIEKLDAALEGFPQITFIDSTVENIHENNCQIDHVTTKDKQVINGDVFILATGATATDLLAESSIDLGIQRIFYGVGTSIEIRSPDHVHTKCIRTPNRGLACGIYSVPYFQSPKQKNDHILIGATNFISPNPYPYGRLTSVESLMRASIEQINSHFYRADLIRVNVGWRPTSQDTLPLIGKTSISNLIIATGTKRDGFHMSPLISEKIAEMVYGDTVDVRFSVFAPERQLLHTLTREQAIKKSVKHIINAAYQHGFQPAHNRMPDQLIRLHTEDLERLHDQVGAYDWGIPPEMIDMYRYGHAKP